MTITSDPSDHHCRDPSLSLSLSLSLILQSYYSATVALRTYQQKAEITVIFMVCMNLSVYSAFALVLTCFSSACRRLRARESVLLETIELPMHGGRRSCVLQSPLVPMDGCYQYVSPAPLTGLGDEDRRRPASHASRFPVHGLALSMFQRCRSQCSYAEAEYHWEGDTDAFQAQAITSDHGSSCNICSSWTVPKLML